MWEKKENMTKSKTRSRIYYKDRITNEIWYYETKWPSVSYDYLEQYMKLNNKKFLYITNILCERKQQTKLVNEPTLKSMQQKD